ncbi:MAG: hypothetical protein WKF73_12220 [Nocardioidaceae bacterium]
MPAWVRPSSSPCSEHWHALAQHHGGQQVALLALAQREHLGVVGLALGAAVP